MCLTPWYSTGSCMLRVGGLNKGRLVCHTGRLEGLQEGYIVLQALCGAVQLSNI